MSALIITNITAISDVPLANTAGDVPAPGIRYEVWPTLTPATVPDWGNGSTLPVGRQLFPGAASEYSTSYRIVGTCAFTSDYPRTMNCKLVGRWGQAPNAETFCESEHFTVTLTTPPPQPPEIRPINVMDVTILAPLSTRMNPVSFRHSGDIYWSVVEVDNPVVREIPALQPTRLEICYLRSKAPDRADIIRSSLMKTGVDMQGKWPIGLLRLFLPRPTDFISFPDLAAIIRWWGLHIINRLQTVRCVFDTISGKSGFGVCCGGGSFDLQLFTQTVLATSGSSSPPPLVNSFDLTALVQLGCALLLDGSGYDEFDSHWVCKTPFGHLQHCMPFHVGPSTFVPWPSGVNNPFFRGMDPPDSPYPSIQNVQVNNSIYLVRARSWLEVSLSNGRYTVLDTSSLVPAVAGGPPLPDDGNRDRQAFIQAHVLDPGNMGNVPDGPAPNGGCYVNNDFSTLQTGEPVPAPPASPYIARMGVYNTDGINHPRSGPEPSPFVPIPTIMRSTITAAIQAGKNPAFPWFEFNDTPLKQRTIIPILLTLNNGTQIPNLSAVIPAAGPASTNIRVTRAATKVMYNFTGMPVTSTETGGTLRVTIDVFDSFRNAYEAMEFELAKYERDVSALSSRLRVDGIAPNTTVYAGHYSIRTPHSILCMRGNLFISMTIIGESRPDDAALKLVTGMMIRLDNYLKNHMVQYSQVRRPSMATVTPVSTRVLENTTFDIVLRDDDTLASQTRAISDKGRLILCGGLASARFSHSCFVGSLDDWPETVRLTLAAAQQDTFHPGWTDYDIEVI